MMSPKVKSSIQYLPFPYSKTIRNAALSNVNSKKEEEYLCLLCGRGTSSGVCAPPPFPKIQGCCSRTNKAHGGNSGGFGTCDYALLRTANYSVTLSVLSVFFLLEAEEKQGRHRGVMGKFSAGPRIFAEGGGCPEV
ncbi:hypothetical protein AVEN_2924-1 [Araneus ventricosus]|uniref:Uncharacterized protein n=1 Tax=Araneus ventricosus TaxID=182803 RepID=A0A4Y2JZQ9_ARAVE|nr:hypothetical protein AVEN_2924-1 [Araneus ventricosus]